MSLDTRAEFGDKMAVHAAKYLGGDFRLPSVKLPELAVMGGRDARLAVRKKGVELAVKDSYGTNYDKVVYWREEIVDCYHVANLWESMGMAIGKSKINLKIKIKNSGGNVHVQLAFLSSSEGTDFEWDLQEAGLLDLRDDLLEDSDSDLELEDES